jgi:hypothetical protein
LQNKKLKKRENLSRDYVKNISEDIITSPRKKVLGKGISFAIILPLRNEM